ncbi:hypothetical protein PIB30_055667, partial [Stylosanthes scabra]|nr:hypothetical protein [Stylosanthes scabra]
LPSLPSPFNAAVVVLTSHWPSLPSPSIHQHRNAGFDPEVIRVDGYGNVLYYHADSASPLAWDIDHWFPCSRGGLTALSNLRILQRQVCKRKKNKLEFLVPWWDFQLGAIAKGKDNLRDVYED